MSKEIRRLIEDLGGKGKYEILEGKVTAVDETDKMVNVEISEGVELFDIKLRSVADGGKDGFVIIPKVGSVIVFAQVRGEDDFILVSTSEVDKVIVEIGTTKLTVTAQGYEMTRGAESMKKILDDLLQAMLDATFTNGAGTTSPANNLVVFQQIKQRIPNLLA